MKKERGDLAQVLGNVQSVTNVEENSYSDEGSVDWRRQAWRYREHLRAGCRRLTSHPRFDAAIIVLIVLNSLLLAVEDPKWGDQTPAWHSSLDYTFTALFALEMLAKVGGDGRAYFRDVWNLFDFVVVLESLLELLLLGLDVSTVDIGWLRVMRVLRPLRTVKRLPVMRMVVTATFRALGTLRYVLVVYLVFLVVMAALLCRIFAGRLTYRCYDDASGAADEDLVCLYEAADYLGETALCRRAMLLGDVETCADYDSSTCLYYGESPNNGILSFDNMGQALLTLFVITTLEGWADPLEVCQAATSPHVLPIFMMVVIIGAFIMVNTIIASLLIEFQHALKEISHEEEGGGSAAASGAGGAEAPADGGGEEEGATAEPPEGAAAGGGPPRAAAATRGSSLWGGPPPSSSAGEPGPGGGEGAAAAAPAGFSAEGGGEEGSAAGGGGPRPRPDQAPGRRLSGGRGAAAAGGSGGGGEAPQAPGEEALPPPPPPPPAEEEEEGEGEGEGEGEDGPLLPPHPPEDGGGGGGFGGLRSRTASSAAAGGAGPRARASSSFAAAAAAAAAARGFRSREPSAAAAAAPARGFALRGVERSRASSAASAFAHDLRPRAPSAASSGLGGVRRSPPPGPPATTLRGLAAEGPPPPLTPLGLKLHVPGALLALQLASEEEGGETKGEEGRQSHGFSFHSLSPNSLKSSPKPSQEAMVMGSQKRHATAAKYRSPTQRHQDIQDPPKEEESPMTFGELKRQRSQKKKAKYEVAAVQDDETASFAQQDGSVEQNSARVREEDSGSNSSWTWAHGTKNQRLKDFTEKDNSPLSKFIFGCIVLNIVLLAMHGHGIPDWMAKMLYYSNIVLVGIFAAEMVLKLAVEGLKGYFKRLSNCLDAAIVAASLAEFAVDTSGSLTSLRALTRLMRAARVARVSKLAARWPQLTQVLRVLVNSFRGVGPVLFLATLMMFVFSILGMQLFGAQLDGTGDSDDAIRYRFDDFIWSYFTTFYIYVGDNWTDVMLLAIDQSGTASCIFFILVILFGHWFLLNMVLAIVLTGCQESLDHRATVSVLEDRADEAVRRLYLRCALRRIREHAEAAARATPEEAELVSRTRALHQAQAFEFPRRTTRVAASAREKLTIVYGRKDQLTKKHDLPFRLLSFLKSPYWLTHHIKDDIEVARAMLKHKLSFHQPLSVPHFRSKTKLLKMLKKISLRLCSSKKTSRFMTVLVIISWLIMFFQEDGAAIYAVDFSLVLVFAAEVLWKSLAFGFRTGPRPFLKSRWNLLDLLLVVVSFSMLVVKTVGRGPVWLVKVLLALKSLRPLRLINRLSTVRRLLASIMNSLLSLGIVGILILGLWFVYSLIGMQLFSGMFYDCSDEDFPAGGYRYGTLDENGDYITPPCSGTFTNASTGEEVTRDYEWTSATYNFDNIFNSMEVVFFLAAVEGWQTPLFSAMDSTPHTDYASSPNNSPWAFLYFTCGVAIFGLYMVNLFIAAVFESFVEETSYGEGGLRFSGQQRLMLLYEDRLRSVQPIKGSQPIGARFGLCRAVHRVGHHPAFDLAVVLVLIANGTTLAFSHARESSNYDEVQNILDAIFSGFYTVEAIIKIMSLGPQAYFYNQMHLFDFTITVVSAYGTLQRLANPCAYEADIFLELFVALRVVRTMTLIRYYEPMRQIFYTIMYPMPKLANIFVLILVGNFIWAMIGHLMFWDVDYGSKYTNFESLTNALQLMAISTSGEFADYLETTLEQSSAHGVPDFFVYFFFLSFFLAMSFLLVNIFVMFVIETFELLKMESVNIIFEELIPTYREVWSKYDPKATGQIPPHQLTSLLLDLPEEIGISPHDPYLYLVHLVDCLEAQPSYDYSFHHTLISVCSIACYPDHIAPDMETSQDLYMLFRKAWAAVVLKGFLRRQVLRYRASKGNDNVTTETSLGKALHSLGRSAHTLVDRLHHSPDGRQSNGFTESRSRLISSSGIAESSGKKEDDQGGGGTDAPSEETGLQTDFRVQRQKQE